MKILYVGDVMGEVGLQVVEQVVPQLRLEDQLDVVIAQAENVTAGRGISVADFNRLRQAGVDFCSGGNWSLWRPEIIPALNDPVQPIIRPANYPTGTPGLGWKYFETAKGRVLIISLLGKIVGRDADKPVENPLKVIDHILDDQKTVQKVATIVNFHGDYSSEKVIIGHYLDGRVTAVVGDHWHVPTADARVLANGTAHQTDVGMVGILNGSLGLKLDSLISRWRDDVQNHNQLETDGQRQFNGLLIETDDMTGKAIQAQAIQKIF